jgi:hypothetical protein
MSNQLNKQVLTKEERRMISSEMRNMILRDQLLSDIAKIKEEMSDLKKEIEDLRLLLNRRLQ